MRTGYSATCTDACTPEKREPTLPPWLAGPGSRAGHVEDPAAVGSDCLREPPEAFTAAHTNLAAVGVARERPPPLGFGQRGVGQRLRGHDHVEEPGVGSTLGVEDAGTNRGVLEMTLRQSLL